MMSNGGEIVATVWTPVRLGRVCPFTLVAIPDGYTVEPKPENPDDD
jgi:hypothetical protein